jgi:hypothetical protein
MAPSGAMADRPESTVTLGSAMPLSPDERLLVLRPLPTLAEALPPFVFPFPALWRPVLPFPVFGRPGLPSALSRPEFTPVWPRLADG